jgi:hypothetical protein
MRTKKEIMDELVQIKKQLEQLSTQNTKTSDLFVENEKLDQTNSHLFDLLKYMINENKRTTMLLQNISESLNRVEGEVTNIEYGDMPPQIGNQIQEARKEIAVSMIDRNILQIIQLSPDGMSCADDVKEKMNYRGRNAASARLNKLHQLGVLERYQIGKKVYYKYDAGKTTNLLIISPSQKDRAQTP